MAKSLYSVVLMDEVVREIDRLALMQNTNRSNLINHILAQYVSYTTPEMRIESIFRNIEDFITSNKLDMVPFVAPHQSTMSLKSSLEYRYRPTIKYDVELYSAQEEMGMGKISVIFRTQSQGLINKMNEFFRIWSKIESTLRKGDFIRYELYEGRFVRSICLCENRNYTANQIAEGISDYIRLFDSCMKNYLTEKFSEADLYQSLKSYIEREVLI